MKLAENPVVVYQALHGEGTVWVRPKHMWDELVNVDGVMVPRFTAKP